MKTAADKNAIRPVPREACPYRRDVPSGIWAATDYVKLLAYDDPTYAQPTAPFACHATPEHYCHGWAVCHGQGLLSLRLRELAHQIPPPAVPLFDSGHEAVAHGIRDIEKPKAAARRMMARLLAKYKRLRDEPTTEKPKQPTTRKTK